MRLLCISTKLTNEQATKIWARSPQFMNMKDFYLLIGEEYLVYGINIRSGEPWVYILPPLTGYLRPVPLCLFKIIDNTLSKYWLINLDSEGCVEISYPSIIDNPYYIDNLSDSKPETVEDFKKIQELISVEFDNQIK